MLRERLPATLLGVLAALAVFVAACETAEEPEDVAAEDDDGESDEGEDEESGDSEDGVVQPLDDGFPEQPITMWNAFDPGHTDDLFNQVVASIGREMSPVDINTDSAPQGPALQYGLVEFLETQPDYDQGYHVYAISYFGSSLRPETVDVLEDNELEDLQPINAMVQAPFVMATNPDDDRFETLEDVEEFARENPGELTTVGSSAGSGLHSSLLVWADQADIEFEFLPTDGAGESRTVMLGGGADLAMLTFDPGMGEEVNLVAQTGDQSASTLEGEVPTTAELGYEIPAGSFRGVGTVPGVPEERMQWLEDFYRAIAESPEFEEEMEGFEIVYMDAEETQELRQEIRDTFIPVMEEAGLTLD